METLHWAGMVNFHRIVKVDHSRPHVTVLCEQSAALRILLINIYWSETTAACYLSPTIEQSRHLLVLNTTCTGGPNWANSEVRVSLTSLSVFTLNVRLVEISCISLLCSAVREESDKNL